MQITRELKQTTTMRATRTSPNKRLNEKNKAVQARYKSLYISLPSSTKQQREMTNVCMRTMAANFPYLENYAAIAYLA